MTTTPPGDDVARGDDVSRDDEVSAFAASGGAAAPTGDPAGHDAPITGVPAFAPDDAASAHDDAVVGHGDAAVEHGDVAAVEPEPLTPTSEPALPAPGVEPALPDASLAQSVAPEAGASTTSAPVGGSSSLDGLQAAPESFGAQPTEWAAPAGAPPTAPGTDPLARSTWGEGQAGKTNVLSIIALIAAIAGTLLFWFVGPIAAVVLGHISLSQIKKRGEKGRPIALWGTILGYVAFAFQLAFVVVLGGVIATILTQLQTTP